MMVKRGLLEHTDPNIRCGVSNLANANRIIRNLMALTTSGETRGEPADG